MSDTTVSPSEQLQRITERNRDILSQGRKCEALLSALRQDSVKYRILAAGLGLKADRSPRVVPGAGVWIGCTLGALLWAGIIAAIYLVRG